MLFTENVPGLVDEPFPTLVIPVKTKGRRKPKTNRAGDKYVPQGHDACQTPAYALPPLTPYLKPTWTIWEPAAGEGLLAEALRTTFNRVIETDLITGQNFFEYTPDREWDVLVTNPPYSVKYSWLPRCYELGKPFALLLPVDVLGAAKAQVLFDKYGTEVIFTNKRINFKMPNWGYSGSGAQFSTAWFTWKLGIGREMTFAKIERD